MVRVSFPRARSVGAAALVVVVSLVIALVLNARDHVPASDDSAPPSPLGEVITKESPAPSSQQPADLTSLLQGTKIHVELLSMYDKLQATSAPSENAADQETMEFPAEKTASLQAKDMPVQNAARKRSAAKINTSDDSLVGISGRSGSHAQNSHALSKFEGVVQRFASTRLGFAQASGIPALAGIAIALVALIAACCVYTVFRRRSANVSSSCSNAKDPSEVLQQREHMLAHKHPLTGDAFYQRSPGSAPRSVTTTPFAPSALHSPLGSSDAGLFASQPVLPVFGRGDDVPKPPPLCPTLVMPVCEARFGIPMIDLAQLTSEGDFNIVGLSGNPLLRAVISKIGNTRMLEIAMPDEGSAPRATITPSTEAVAGCQEGSRALQIKGLGGSFYGMLEMRASGACYVIKDGQTVLAIDGDADSLQLSIKSSVGLPLASVRCSAEPFGGVDHVEIRVEPGVDTVLVLAVVLAILLLSPYMPPND